MRGGVCLRVCGQPLDHQPERKGGKYNLGSREPNRTTKMSTFSPKSDRNRPLHSSVRPECLLYLPKPSHTYLSFFPLLRLNF